MVVHLAKSAEKVKFFLNDARRSGLAIGLVPTMGFLHEGHLSLVRTAREDNDICAVSIFVNPLQFGPSEDLEAYPRDLERDLRLLSREGVDLVFVPEVAELYYPDRSVLVTENLLSRCLCGSARPGHFDGVCTVVLKLFNIVRPDRAYFGQKDYQQLQIIKRMVRDLNVPVEIIGCPIVRERDGLAMSSRNIYLDQPAREAALSLSRALGEARSLFEEGERSPDVLLSAVRRTVSSCPLVVLEYAEVRDAEDLSPVATVKKQAVLALAARVGRARLIDNILLEPGVTCSRFPRS